MQYTKCISSSVGSLWANLKLNEFLGDPLLLVISYFKVILSPPDHISLRIHMSGDTLSLTGQYMWVDKYFCRSNNWNNNAHRWEFFFSIHIFIQMSFFFSFSKFYIYLSCVVCLCLCCKGYLLYLSKDKKKEQKKKGEQNNTQKCKKGY